MGIQVAMALVLLVASGLMLRSFQKLRAVDPGFDATSTLTFRIELARTDYPDRGRMVVAHRAIVDRLAALPGVSAVSASTCLPLSEGQLCQGGPLFIDGHPFSPGAVSPFVASRAIDGGYFGTMRTRVLRGRGIERSDVDREEPIVVVNQALVNIRVHPQKHDANLPPEKDRGFARGGHERNTFRWRSGDEDAAREWDAVGPARPAAARVG
jgi:putative ABC transport system permease protein